MDKRLIYGMMFASLMLGTLTLGKGTLAADVDRHFPEDSPHLALRTYDARLSPLQKQQATIVQADCVVLHVDSADLKKTIELLQKPYYDVDLAGEEISIQKLRELLPIALQVIALNLMESRLKNDAFPVLGQLTALKSLIISDNPFDDAAMPDLRTLGNLRHLDMVHTTKVSDVGLESLIPLNLEILDAGCNSIKNSGIRSISKISSLTNVDVRACEFDASVLPLFFELPNLRKLNISQNKLDRLKLEEFLRQARDKGIEVKADEIL